MEARPKRETMPSPPELPVVSRWWVNTKWRLFVERVARWFALDMLALRAYLHLRRAFPPPAVPEEEEEEEEEADSLARQS